MTRLNQVIIGANPGDAITDEAFMLRRWLREMGFASDIYAQYIHPALVHEVRSVTTWRPARRGEALIYHHSIGSAVVDQLLATASPLILIYHNVTPPEFLAETNPALSRELGQGRAQLGQLRLHTRLALADSPFNEQELLAAGFGRTGVLPLALDERDLNLLSQPELLARYRDPGPYLLFVGRQVPNKKQEDLIKLLYFYLKIEPRARLFLVGEPWITAYADWLRDLTIDLGLAEAVVFAGKTTQPQLLTYYSLADLYVSMSEHEGFGKPLIESMYLGVPVLAYAAAAVPSTLQDAGILFHHKDYAALAELVHLLVNDDPLRRTVIARQRERVKEFLEPAVRAHWQHFLTEAEIVPNNVRGKKHD